MATKYLSYDGALYFWGKIKAYFVPATRTVNSKALSSNITLDNTDVGAAATSHAHGNVASGGTLQTTDISVASGDKIVVTDNSDSDKVARTSIAFDGSTETKALTQKGTWATFASSDTTYDSMSDTEGKTGTATTQRTITASNLKEIITYYISQAQTGAAMFKGAVSAGSAISGLTAYSKGWYWLVDTAGTYVGEACEPGDMIFCIDDFDTSYSASDFTVIQTNIDVITAVTNGDIDTIVAT